MYISHCTVVMALQFDWILSGIIKGKSTNTILDLWRPLISFNCLTYPYNSQPSRYNPICILYERIYRTWV